MEIHPIRTEQDYKGALRRISALMDQDPDPKSPDGEVLDILVTLVQAYEAKHYPIDPPDPIEAIKFRMEQMGLTVDDLSHAIGRPNRVYEILARRRPLTLSMIRKLNTDFNIPASVLISDYPTVTRHQVPA